MDGEQNGGDCGANLARSTAEEAENGAGHAKGERLRSLYLTRAPGRAGRRARRLLAQAERRNR